MLRYIILDSFGKARKLSGDGKIEVDMEVAAPCMEPDDETEITLVTGLSDLVMAGWQYVTSKMLEYPEVGYLFFSSSRRSATLTLRIRRARLV